MGCFLPKNKFDYCLSLFYVWAAFCLRKKRSPAPIFFPFLHHRRQVFPLPLQNCRIPENKRKKGYPPLPFRYVQALPSLSMLGREFACRKLTALTGCQWFTEESSLQCKLEVQECTGRTFFNDDIHSSRKMVGIPPSHE